MKKHLLHTAIFLLALSANAQEPTPAAALRYAIDNTQGTARYRGMSGAFGAVGGDLSSINVNPAGSAIFSSNSAGLTISVYNNKNEANYFGGRATENNSSFNFNQMGGVMVFNNIKPNSDWRKFTMAINYETTNDFDNDIYTQGVNPDRSIGEYFTAFANGFGGMPGIPVGVLENSDYAGLPFADQQAWLGYRTYMFDPVTSDTYISNVPTNADYYQTNLILSDGYNGKLSFNFATSYRDVLYLGLNLNSHWNDYYSYSSVYESNNGPDNPGRNTLHNVVFNNYMRTYGSGFSFSLGAIAKLNEAFRVGFAYESPTWYHMNDELSQDISTRFSNSDGVQSSAYENPYVINIYPSYKIHTPWKINTSATYLFGKKGLISFDYSLKDYSKTEFEPEHDIFFQSVNDLMSKSLRMASEFRTGFEYRVKQVSLRGGYRFEQSPYEDGRTIGDLHGFSTGIGYNFGFSRLDFAYAYSQRDQEVSLLSSFTDSATVTTKTNNFFLTYSFNF